MLAAGTKEVHEKAENTQFVKDFLRGRIKRELFKVSPEKKNPRNIYHIYRLANKNSFLWFPSCFDSLDLWHFTIPMQRWKRKLRGTKTIPILPHYIFLQSCTATRLWPVTLSTFMALTGRAR